jgi:hypothetical protein
LDLLVQLVILALPVKVVEDQLDLAADLSDLLDLLDLSDILDIQDILELSDHQPFGTLQVSPVYNIVEMFILEAN